MLRRVCIAQSEVPGPSGEPFVIAWPWSNNPAHLTPQLSRAVSLAVDQPVLLLASDSDGIHTYGTREHTAVAATLNFKAVRWSFIDIEDGGPPRQLGRDLAA